MNPTVFFIEKEPCRELHAHILNHLPKMQHWYEWQGCELVYLPLHELASVDWNSIHDYLAYQYPVLNRPEFEEVLGTLREPAHMLVNKLLQQTNLQDSAGRAFLLYTNRTLQKKVNPYKVLAQYLPQQNTVEEFFLDGFKNLWEIQEPVKNRYQNDVHFSIDSAAPSLSRNFDLELCEASDSSFQAEDEFIPILSDDVKEHIEAIMRVGDKSTIVNVLVHLLNNLNPYFRADQKSVLKMLEKNWSQYAVAQHSSRIMIDKHAKIFLTDFGNMEIKMPPLPKTLYLFYLRHPEGVACKDLSDHKAVLEQIYSKISNSSNPEQIIRSINDLVDLRENSIHEKFSRIKEAFVKVMALSIAKPYLIAGPRGGVKKIDLDQSLISYDLGQEQELRDQFKL